MFTSLALSRLEISVMADWLNKLPDFLKAPAELGFTVSASTALALYLADIGMIPFIKGTLWESILWVAMLLSGAVAAAGVLRLCKKLIVHVYEWLVERSKHKDFRKSVTSQLDLLDADEKRIFGYLIHKNTNTFRGHQNGGHAANLIGRGFVRMNVANAQRIDPFDVPYIVHPVVWDVVNENKEKFPYEPQLRRGVEVEPWRMPIM